MTLIGKKDRSHRLGHGANECPTSIQVYASAKNAKPFAGCGRVAQVNLSYQFESKIRNLLSGSQVHIDVAKRRHFKDLTRTTGADHCLAASPLCAPKMSAQHKGPSLPAPNLKAEISSLTIPRLPSAPKLDDFEGMEPVTDLARKMLKIDKFIQQEPRDGEPVSQPTEAYLGYTGKNFYAVFLCFDKEPKKIRARMLRRELIDDDDQVGLWLDTFHDQRHAYYFYSNPYGIQQDGLFAESGGPDNSFDTVWHTTGKLTGNGYMVMIEIPFKSLRFRQQPSL